MRNLQLDYVDSVLIHFPGLPVEFDCCWKTDCPEHSIVGYRPRITCSHNGLYTQRTLFRPGGVTQEGLPAYGSFYSQGPFRHFKIRYPWQQQQDSLQWFGGTYAAHPQFFPREQCRADWIRDHLLPLSIAARARCAFRSQIFDTVCAELAHARQNDATIRSYFEWLVCSQLHPSYD